MKLSARTKVVIVVLLLALAGWNLYANRKETGDLNIVDRTVLFITAPVQKGVTWALHGVGGLFSGYVALVGVERDNELLREELARMEGVEIRLRELELENDRLRELAGLRQRLELDTISASVIGWGTSSRYRVVRIDRGRAHGVLPGQAVVGLVGVVGQVLHTSAGAADVLLLSDISSGVAARLQESRLRGIVVGDGRWGAALQFVARQEATTVVEGEMVVTSGDDGVYPPGIPVGRVARVEAGETGQFLDVRLAPTEDLAQLQEVMVVLSGDAAAADLAPAFAPPPGGDTGAGGDDAVNAGDDAPGGLAGSAPEEP